MQVNHVYCGRSEEVLRDFPDNCIDAVVTDPPYGLEFMGKEWDAPWKYGMATFGFSDGKSRNVAPQFTSNRNPVCRKCHRHKRGSRNHEACGCEEPDFDDIEHRLRDMRMFQGWCRSWASEVFRILKPGGHLLAFGGTRTYHRMACAVEDAGFEIRDQLQWLYGSGFPKSHDISKAIDKMAGAEREVVGQKFVGSAYLNTGSDHERNGQFIGGQELRPVTAPATEEAKQWDGWGTALKPANEPIVLARKPLSERTIAANVLKWGTGGLNIDGSRIGTDTITSRPSNMSNNNHYAQDKWTKSNPVGELKTYTGRFPANVLLDEEAAEMLDEQNKGASRFFYVAKASKKERTHNGKVENKHPTVKPIKLMEYLIRLVTPPGGIVLDPFCGSGSTLIAARNLGFDFIGIDMSEEYVALTQARLAEVRGDKEPSQDAFAF